MTYPRLSIRTGIVQNLVDAPTSVESDVSFHLLGNRADWASSDYEKTGVIDDAKVSLAGPDHATGKMFLVVEGWARSSAIGETATFQRWELTLA